MASCAGTERVRNVTDHGEEDDELKTAKGILAGVVVGILIWVVVAGMIYVLL